MLKDIFLELIGKYSVDEVYNNNCWIEIEKKYSESGRYYHTLSHLEKMYAEFRNVVDEIAAPDVLMFALFYHDIIYDPKKSDNEEQSAFFFQLKISPTTFPNMMECMDLIKITNDHKKSLNNDFNIFLDMDLSILGSEEDVYQKYCKQIRAEYKMYSNAEYNQGRKKILNHFLSQESIFKTRYFIEKYEIQAKENLEKELMELN